MEYASYFGRLHIHPTSGAPVGHPTVHLVHRGAEDTTANHLLGKRTNSITWHSDVTYEAQPPGTTFLYLLDGPKAGGDTLFSNQVEAYNRFSEGFKERLHGLKALHSGQFDAGWTLLAFIHANFAFQVSSRRKIANFEAASFAENLLLRSILLFEHIRYDIVEIQVCGLANIYKR